MSEQHVFVEVKTEEQARKLLTELVVQVEEARQQTDELHELSRLNVPGPGGQPIRPELVRKAFSNWAIRYGRALGTLTTFMHCRILNDVAYAELRQRIVQTGVPRLSAGVFA